MTKITEIPIKYYRRCMLYNTLYTVYQSIDETDGLVFD